MRKDKLEQRLAEMRARNAKPAVEAAPITVSSELLTAKQAADRLAVSTEWVRKYFSRVPGVLSLPTARKAQRSQVTLRIPVEVFEREYKKFAA